MAPRLSQDFLIPFRDATPRTLHQLFQNGGTAGSLEPRVPRMLGRLNITERGPQTGRGLLKKLALGGHNLVLGDGFPLPALNPDGLVDRHNLIGCAASPKTPLELEISYAQAQPLTGWIGTDPIPPELEAEIVDYHQRGQLWGQPNFAWGLGEQLGPVNATGTVTFSKRIPRGARLERIAIGGYRSDGAPINIDQVFMTRFEIAGNPMFSKSGALDLSLISAFASDEDGLMIDQVVQTDDLVEIDILFDVPFGAGINGIVQLGFFTS